MWQKWDESPILMSLDTNNYQLSNVPFPAVTICNVNKVSKSHLLRILSEEKEFSKFSNMSYDTSVEILRYLTKLDRAILKGDDLKRLDAFLRSQNISTTELVNILQQTAPSCRLSPAWNFSRPDPQTTATVVPSMAAITPIKISV